MLSYQSNGNLVPGIYELSWNEFVIEFGFNNHRKVLIRGLEVAIAQLRRCGCRCIYVDGSFVSKKTRPTDYDVCWDTNGVRFEQLEKCYPTLIDFSHLRQNQKKAYGGEFHPMTWVANPPKEVYLDFFQHDKEGNPKGIVKLLIF